jgi:hypothetical protein
MADFHQIADRLGIKYPGLSFSIEGVIGEPIEYLSADFRLNDEARLSFEVGLTLSAKPEEPAWYSRIELASACDEHVLLSQGEGQAPDVALAGAIEGLGKMAVLFEHKEGEGDG